MRSLMLLAMSLSLAVPVCAGEPSPATRAKAALALAARPPQSVARLPQSVVKVSVCPCGCGCTDCSCVAGECGGKDCTCASKPRKPRMGCPCGCSCGRACACTRPGECGDSICTCGTSKSGLSYADAFRKAVAENKPLIIWLGVHDPMHERQMRLYVHVHMDSYVGDNYVTRAPGVIVGRPDGEGGIDRLATLPGFPTARDIQDVLTPPRRVQYAPPPMMMPMPMMPMMGGFGGGCSGGS